MIKREPHPPNNITVVQSSSHKNVRQADLVSMEGTIKEMSRKKSMEGTIKERSRKKSMEGTIKEMSRKKSIERTIKEMSRKKSMDGTSRRSKPNQTL
jgi:hypothetical protein